MEKNILEVVAVSYESEQAVESSCVTGGGGCGCFDGAAD